MEIFYLSDIDLGMNTLGEEETSHIVKVLRKKINDTVNITDGKGRIYSGVIINLEKKKAVIDIRKIETIEKPRNYYFHLAVAPTKSIDRFEWIIEKCVEIGIDEISLLICSHSERKTIKYERLMSIATSAMKQSGNVFLPKINNIQTFKQFVYNNYSYNKYIAHCHNFNLPFFYDAIEGNSNLIMIGPEGDFSEDEIIQASKLGYKEVTLGKNVLRVETAAIIACATTSIKNFNK